MPASSCVLDLYPSLQSLSETALAAQLALAESYAERYLGRKLSPGSSVDTFDGKNYSVLVLNNVPVSSVDKIVYVTNGTRHEYPSSSGHYQWSSDGRVVLRNNTFMGHLPGFRPGLFNIEVHYQHTGLTQVEIDSIIGAVANWRQVTAKTNPLMESETIGSYSYKRANTGGGSTSPSVIPHDVSSLLDQYKRHRIV